MKRTDPLAVTCPMCSSLPGNECVNGNFQVINGPHPERVRLAERITEYHRNKPSKTDGPK